LSMWKDESALATLGNLCAPMGWMTCGALLETLGGTYFGCVGKILKFLCGWGDEKMSVSISFCGILGGKTLGGILGGLAKLIPVLW